jgi:hypothetical protein
MEVHHHPHGSHGPKKFKDYFQEFLMIFLAVFMGFLAENVREYLTDKNHVQELAGQLKADLKNDTVKAQRLIEFEANQVKRVDSLFAMLILPAGQINYMALQDMVVSCDRIDFFYPSTGAISTIKRELQLKEFVKTKIALHIDNYEKTVTVLQAFEIRDVDYMGKYLESFLTNHFTPQNAALAVLRLPVKNGEMRNLKPADLVQFSVDINLIKAYDLVLLNRYRTVKTEAMQFIDHINTTYKLDD